MSSKDDFHTLIYIAFIIALVVALSWLWKMRFDDCMVERHDKMFCEIYARLR